ncbi:MAG: MBL fold metallo-hydrolase [Gammaproteobacteria bacterium]|nr:MBL fold metallo-hydrolase [Gammaproteobacteria bacterium]
MTQDFSIRFLGAAGTVTGSCYLITAGTRHVLLECGLYQGSRDEEARNAVPLPIAVDAIDAVVLSHAHIDHSGRLPWLVRQGYQGPIHTQHASRALCGVMLPDSGYLQEQDAEWQNRKRERKGLPPVTPLYTRADAERMLPQFDGIDYGEAREIVPNLTLTLHDAGHILGSAIVELRYRRGGRETTVVFSGDLGWRGTPVMNDPALVEHADLVLLESTYGERAHRSFAATLLEFGDVFREAAQTGGNILIPAFAVGRTQDLLFLMAEHYDEWDLGRWQIFLDSPMAIQATEIYGRYQHLYETRMFSKNRIKPALPNLRMSRSSAESMEINNISSGAIIIAGSGMCNGGRIQHHLKRNVWRPGTHIVFIGYQATGTLGRRLVDGAAHIRLWGEAMQVRARIHTIGGLSAHADQPALLDWYGGFRNRPPVCLVHGEANARATLAAELEQRFGITPRLPAVNDTIAL